MKKMEPTTNVFALCNFDMEFIYAYVGVPGKAHDIRVLTYFAKMKFLFHIRQRKILFG